MSVTRDTDLLGNQLSPAEMEIVEVYRRLQSLVGREDLPPCAAANLRHSLAFCATVVGDLALDYEHLIDSGV